MKPHPLESYQAEAYAGFLLILLFGVVCAAMGYFTALAWSRDPPEPDVHRAKATPARHMARIA
jgi:hypothetical protein